MAGFCAAGAIVKAASTGYKGEQLVGATLVGAGGVAVIRDQRNAGGDSAPAGDPNSSSGR